MLNKVKSIFRKVFKQEKEELKSYVDYTDLVEEERAIGLAVEEEIKEKDFEQFTELINSGLEKLEKAAVIIRETPVEKPKVIRDPLFEKIDKCYLIQNRTKKWRIRKKQDVRLDKIFDEIDKRIWC